MPQQNPQPAQAARDLIRGAKKAVLATLEPESGAPYASLVLLATDTDGAPTLLLSQLARHTRNITADGRASLLIDGTDAAGDPMAGGRVSLSGTVSKTSTASARARFLSWHPAATGYADFPDFAFYRFELASAHLIQGFGRIVDFSGLDLLEMPRAM